MPNFCMIVIFLLASIQTHGQRFVQPKEVAELDLRISEYQSIVKSPRPYGDAERKKILLLLKQENDLVAKVLTRSGGRVGIGVEVGEEYAEYYAQLLGTASEVADWSDERQFRILAESSYNPDSAFASRLAEHGEITLRVFSELARDQMPTRRANALGVLGITLAQVSHVRPRIINAVRVSLLKGLEDPNIDARIQAVRAIGNGGTQADVQVLRRIAETDPVTFGDPPIFPVRREAEKAIARIFERESTKQ